MPVCLRHAGTRFCLLPVGQVELEGGDDAAVCHFSIVFHDVDAELHDVARAELVWLALVGRKTGVVDKSAIAAFGILKGQKI